MYSQLSPYGHPAITDIPLLKTGARSSDETTKKCMTEGADFHYNGRQMTVPRLSVACVQSPGLPGGGGGGGAWGGQPHRERACTQARLSVI